MKYYGHYLREHAKSKDEQRAQVIEDGLVLWLEDVPGHLKKTSLPAAPQRLALEIARAAPKTDALVLAAVRSAGAAKALAATAAEILANVPFKAIEGAWARCVRSEPSQAKIIKSADGLAQLVDAEHRPALYQTLECHGHEKARAHAQQRLESMGAEPSRPWAGWSLPDPAKAVLLKVGLPSAHGLRTSRTTAIYLPGALIWYRADGRREGDRVTLGLDDNGAELAVTLGANPKLVRVQDGRDEGTVGPIVDLDRRARIRVVELAPDDASQVRLSIGVNRLADEVLAAIVGATGWSSQDAQAAIGPTRTDPSPLDSMARAEAEAIARAVWMAGGSAFLVPALPTSWAVEVDDATASSVVSSVLGTKTELSATQRKAQVDGLPGAVFESPSRAAVYELAVALREAEVSTRLAERPARARTGRG